MDELRALKYFLKVAETGSFTLAANYFNVPPSSLSRRVSDLESHLGANLLHRTTRVVKLTDVGQQYYQQAKDILTQLEDANESARSHNTEPKGLLRISSLVSFGESTLLPLLEEFKERYPQVVLDVTLSDQLAAFNRDEADIALRGGYAPNERIMAIKLFSNQFYLFASPGYLRQRGVPVKAEELPRHNGLFFRTPGGVQSWLVHDDDHWQNVSAQPTVISNNGQWLLKQAVDGRGLLMAPRWFTAQMVQQGALVELTMTPQVYVAATKESGHIYLLYQKQRYQQAKIKAAVDFLVARIRQD
ncbi:LysR family transcriptional regulator [Reinekea marinisedimentorum]|uniref:DNA-binding transcriptional LysR family regulator n=1 Tax=Reinekea marinisedimentorum TaxID=230495 RepID=A0A4R3I493_9GAMM|nr:LysR family transcriptional regulator [Reinekea marinisedimentorum]TCS38769.1 DNA-binding transcriptional LysR family regulator [Reinekea marinisedimentorum]